MRRETFLTGAISTGAVFSMATLAFAKRADATALIAQLEKRTGGGRLGVFALDTHTGQTLAAHRPDERFPMCSTFKLLAVSAVLARVDAGKEHLERHVKYSKSDLLAYAPITTKNVAQGFMTVSGLCEAAMDYSDNTAANLLVASVGGPPAVTRFARTLGDTVTRLDRTEPALNDAVPGDVRDTTSPAAMASTMRRLLLGNALSNQSRARLMAWLVANKTGDTRLRVGIPKSWRAGDKTGTGKNGTRNDIAIMWPPHRPPLLITAYLTGSTVSPEAGDAIIADVGRVLSGSL